MLAVQCWEMALDGPQVNSAAKAHCPDAVQERVTVRVYSVLVKALLCQRKRVIVSIMSM